MTTKKLMKTYSPLPVTFTHGEGAWLWDSNGNKYLDALCGIAVTGLGHAHQAISEAICGQAHRLLHTSNLFEIELQNQLAEKLTALARQVNNGEIEKMVITGEEVKVYYTVEEPGTTWHKAPEPHLG